MTRAFRGRKSCLLRSCDGRASPIIAIERRDADECGELAAIQPTKFGQFGDEGSRRDGTDARNRR